MKLDSVKEIAKFGSREKLCYTYIPFLMCVCVQIFCLLELTIICSSSLKQPEYQCYREQFGVARSMDTMVRLTAELKSLLLVS